MVILPAARADLIDIGDYIARDNPPRAASFVAEIERRL
ncbi:type II toxin-antitoxin system RelE/ParE family toxin [Sulfitobacter sp. 915]